MPSTEISQAQISPSLHRLASKMRAQSPSSSHQYHHSPTRHRSNPPNDDRKEENKTVEKKGGQSKAEPVVKSSNTNLPSAKAEITNDNSKSCNSEKLDKTLNVDLSKKSQSPDQRNQTSSKVDSSDKKMLGNLLGGDSSKGRVYF